MLMNDTIVVVNRSTVLTDAQIQAVIPAFQQSANDFESVWGLGQAKIEFNNAPPAGSWLLEVYDHTDTPGAGGYHLDMNGQVSGKVFAADAIQTHEAWTVDATHEMLEMIGDPFTNAVVPLPDQSLEWFREVCDPVESDIYGYVVGGVLVTDFVLPGYADATGPFDFKGHLRAGCPTLLAGGYVTLYDPRTDQFHQLFAKKADGTMSRRGRNSHRRQRIVFG